MFYLKNKSQFCRILISCQSFTIHFVIIIDYQRVKVIDSFFNSCIDKFVTSSRYEFVTTFTFHFVHNIDFLIWLLMRFRWISKLQFFVERFFFEKFFEFVFLLLHFNYLTRIRFEFTSNLSRIISSLNFLLMWWLFLYFCIVCLMHT